MLKRALVAFTIFAVAPAVAPAAVILTAADVADPPAGGSGSDEAGGVAAAAEGEKAKPEAGVPASAGWTGSLIALAALGYAVRRKPAELLPQSV